MQRAVRGYAEAHTRHTPTTRNPHTQLAALVPPTIPLKHLARSLRMNGLHVTIFGERQRGEWDESE